MMFTSPRGEQAGTLGRMDNYIQALKADFEELLGQFQRTDSVRYENFLPIWRNLDFPSLFYGKIVPNEMRIFCRLALATAYQYFLPPYTFQIRVGGLYLLYGLYHTQLASPKEKIRIALKDWEEVMKFQQDAANAQHYDVVYILRKLLSEKSFYFAAMPKQLNYQSKKKPLRNEVCEEFRERPQRVKDLISMDTLEEVMNVQQHYEKMKAAISATPGQLDSAINFIRKDLVSQLRSTMMEYHKLEEQQSRDTVPKSGDGDNAAGEGSSEQQEASKSRRHRQVEMDTSGSGTDPSQLVLFRKKKRPLSLKARTKKNLIDKVGTLKQEATEFTGPGMMEENSKGFLHLKWTMRTEKGGQEWCGMGAWWEIVVRSGCCVLRELKRSRSTAWEFSYKGAVQYDDNQCLC
ncbi:snRNA-activating protein complex subunit 1-like [Scleropages formosus]|uniref:snRNA-activating protein complex subunit 1-like n=1 Tax=Scleropages formosus TaxID=113540 RepID=A0A0P7WA75_SCLFO|nr:snRNA-activating protein complex subunit 1-like [Scleropages formosus]